MARKKSILTEKQETYVEHVLDGHSRGDAALAAGYSSRKQTSVIERSEDVRQAIAEARSELSSAAQIRRMDLVMTLQEAVDMARMMADPTGMIAGVREIGKMLGLYAPEEKKIDLTVGQQRLRSQFEGMTDQELIEVIEGQASRVPD